MKQGIEEGTHLDDEERVFLDRLEELAQNVVDERDARECAVLVDAVRGRLGVRGVRLEVDDLRGVRRAERFGDEERRVHRRADRPFLEERDVRRRG